MAIQVAAEDTDDHAITLPHSRSDIPTSPPPSFRSRTSSRRVSRDEQESEEERNLNDAFDAPSDDEDEDGGPHDQRRLISGDHTTSPAANDDEEGAGTTMQRPTAGQRRVTEIPVFAPTTTTAGSRSAPATNDGIWANLNAKPRAGDDVDEKPPTYEQAAADATPPYWETTVLSP